jgi:3-hydroxyisobutyrate dehydrogenase
MGVSVDDSTFCGGDAGNVSDEMIDPLVQPAVIRSVAVLGTGIMGTELVRNLLGAGLQVRVWNRTAAKAEALTAEGAQCATSPALAATGVDAVITMLSDGPAVHAAMTGPTGALRGLNTNAVWVQMSTVGIQWCDRLAHLASQHGIAFIDAPVSGSAEAARHRQLLILASGAQPRRDVLNPVFEALGRRTMWLDRVGDGSRLKLVLNNWLAILVEGIAESLSLSAALDVSPHLFLSAIDGGSLAARYATDKANAMLAGDFTPGFPLRHAAKDATLAIDAAHAHGVDLSLTATLLAHWRRAIAEGHGGDDVASAVTTSTEALYG